MYENTLRVILRAEFNKDILRRRADLQALKVWGMDVHQRGTFGAFGASTAVEFLAGLRSSTSFSAPWGLYELQ